MVNAYREESSAVLSFLLEYNAASKSTINARDRQGYLPLHLLASGLKQQMAVATSSNRVSDDPEKRATVSECLTMYLAAEPKPVADFLAAIQDLPDWLQDTAVVSKHIRNVLNEKIVQRFPSSIMMMDGIALLVLVVCFAKTTKNHIDLRFDPESSVNDTRLASMLVLSSATYFFLRELVQFVSLFSLGNISQWFRDPANWLDMCVIILTYYYGITMVLSAESSLLNSEAFRSGVTYTQGILWVAVIVYLKNTLVDFAVFVGGVFYVVQRLAAFIIAVGVILLAFAQMFYFIYVNTEMCNGTNGNSTNFGFDDGFNGTIGTSSSNFTTSGFLVDDDEYELCAFPHCRFANSFLKVYTMMMGEIGTETRYATSLVGQILYIGYGFLVVILLSNVLIAIVQDSYEIIQNERAAIVFWSNRLDFVAEMDSISYAIQRRLGVLNGAKDATTHYNNNPHLEGKSYHEYDHYNRGAEQPPPLVRSVPSLPRDSEHSVRFRSTVESEVGRESVAVDSDRGENNGGSGRATTTSGIENLLDFQDGPDTALNPLDEPDMGIEYFREAWHQLMSLFDANLYDDIDWIDSWVHNVFRILSIFVIIPLWLFIGFITAGWLWPPQVREYLFVQKETAIGRAELELQKLSQLKAIQTELKELKTDIMREMEHDRDEIVRLKAEMESIQSEIYADLLQIKELMDSLLVIN